MFPEAQTKKQEIISLSISYKHKKQNYPKQTLRTAANDLIPLLVEYSPSQYHESWYCFGYGLS